MNRPIHLAAFAPLLIAAAPASEPPVADLDLSLRCAAAFGLVGGAQASGSAEALQYPPLAQRGREFFVQIASRAMDEKGLTREQVAERLLAEARALQPADPRSAGLAQPLRDAMPACVALLDAAVPSGTAQQL